MLLTFFFFCKRYFFYFEDSKISKVLYATNYDNSPYATDFNVYPGKSYSVSIKVLRNGLGNADAKVSKIKLNGQNIGECNPDGLDDDCTFFDCDSSRKKYIPNHPFGDITIHLHQRSCMERA